MARTLNKIDPASDEAREVRREFEETVNMTAAALERWLDTEQSKSVGQSSSGGESVGHRSGRRIVTILRTATADLSPSDYAHMKKVNGYVARHLKQRPDQPAAELHETPWTYSLKNWGHDPVS